jgi:MinD superfamily P-loop ATPase
MDRREFILKGTGLGILGGISLIGLAQKPVESNKKYTVIAQRCSGCGHCFKACRDEALIVKEGKAIIILEKCKGCGDCTRYCRNMAIVLKEEKGASEKS